MGMDFEYLVCMLDEKYWSLTLISRLGCVSSQNLFYLGFHLFYSVNIKLIFHIILLVTVCKEDRLKKRKADRLDL